jgi:hypothetical protein
MIELTGSAAVARISSDVFQLLAPERIEHDEEGGTPLAMDGDGFLVPLGAYETATVRVGTGLTWGPVTLMADKGPGAVHLSWTGGRTPYTLRRSDDALFSTGVVTLVDEQPVTTHDDPALMDDKSYFYLAY